MLCVEVIHSYLCSVDDHKQTTTQNIPVHQPSLRIRYHHHEHGSIFTCPRGEISSTTSFHMPYRPPNPLSLRKISDILFNSYISFSVDGLDVNDLQQNCRALRERSMGVPRLWVPNLQMRTSALFHSLLLHFWPSQPIKIRQETIFRHETWLLEPVTCLQNKDL